MPILLFAFIVVIVLFLVLYGLDQIVMDAPLKTILKVIAIFGAALLILTRSGVLRG